jgi:hypothetical protein
MNECMNSTYKVERREKWNLEGGCIQTDWKWSWSWRRLEESGTREVIRWGRSYENEQSWAITERNLGYAGYGECWRGQDQGSYKDRIGRVSSSILLLILNMALLGKQFVLFIANFPEKETCQVTHLPCFVLHCTVLVNPWAFVKHNWRRTNIYEAPTNTHLMLGISWVFYDSSLSLSE